MTVKNINYSTMAIVEDLADSDSDEYLPQPDPLPKLDNKCKPSASRIGAQHRKKRRDNHDEPQPDGNEHASETPPDSKTTSEEKPSKGELNCEPT